MLYLCIYSLCPESFFTNLPAFQTSSKTKAVICTTFAAGKEHDFHLFKRSRVKLKKETQCLADKGYQGIQKLHANSQLPKKKRKGEQLNQLDREKNQSLERTRGICEHIIGRLKVFKILAERYRNRRRRFGLRFNLIAGLYNYELGSFQAFITYARCLTKAT